MKATARYANLVIEAEAEDLKGIIAQLAVLSEIPEECPECGAACHLFHRMAKSFHFYGVACRGTPSHEATFGQHLTGGTFFYKPGAWRQAYDRGEQDETDETRAETAHAGGGRRGQQAAVDVYCSGDECGQLMSSQGQIQYSQRHFGRPLCIDCQPKYPRIGEPHAPAAHAPVAQPPPPAPAQAPAAAAAPEPEEVVVTPPAGTARERAAQPAGLTSATEVPAPEKAREAVHKLLDRTVADGLVLPELAEHFRERLADPAMTIFEGQQIYQQITAARSQAENERPRLGIRQ